MSHALRRLLVVITFGALVGLAPGGDESPQKKPEKPAKEQYRVLVAQGEQNEPGGQWFYLDRVVTVGTPFDVRGKDDEAAAKGVLQRTETGGLHFKGQVRVGYNTGSVDAAVELGRVFKAPPAPGGTPSPLFVRFERLKPEGAEKVKLIKKASDVSEKLGGGKDGSTGDQLLVVPGPRPQKQTPSEWFQSRLKADNRPTADTETWLLFRSAQMSDYDRMSIERVEREGTTFTVTTKRVIYGGPLWRNVTYHEVHGINLGELPAGDYTVKWTIGLSSFTLKGGVREDREHGVWKELSQKFSVRAAAKKE